MSKSPSQSSKAITVTPAPLPATGPLRVILYTRVSTDTQAEQGLGLAMQERAIRDWAKANGHKVVGKHSDSGISGSNGLDTRPGLAAAFGDLEDGKADALAVYRLDRLARKLASQETWIERLEQAGRQVISVTEPQYGDDEMRTLVRQILGAVAQYERVVIVKRMQGGRRAKHERGGYAYGGPPYGWHAEGGELVPDPQEQAIRDRMASMRAAGRSLRQIADTLNAEGTTPRRGQWHPQTVARALDRPDGPDQQWSARKPAKPPAAPRTQSPVPSAGSAPKAVLTPTFLAAAPEPERKPAPACPHPSYARDWDTGRCGACGEPVSE